MSNDTSVFPVPNNALCSGISTRDWLAAVALQGLLTKGLKINADRAMSEEEKDDQLAIQAYRAADAMIRVRETATTK